MRRTADFWLLAAILIIGGMMALTSCSERNNPVVSPDEPQVENLADVTVMIYGSGGGSLDPNLITKLHRIYDADPASFERVKVAVQYKFSQPKKVKGWPDDETKNEFYATLEREGEEYVERNAGGRNYFRWMGAKGNATLSYVVDPEQTLYRQSKTSWLPDDNMDITHPDSLASFIRWAAQQCPARRYVLLMTDHGRGFLPHEEGDPNETIITRSMVEDMGARPSPLHRQNVAPRYPEIGHSDYYAISRPLSDEHPRISVRDEGPVRLYRGFHLFHPGNLLL